MRLHDWNTVRQDLDFDPDTGETRLLPLPAPRSERCPVQGFAAFERSLRGRRIPCALYRSGNGLFFSAAGRKWNLTDPGLSFSHQRFVLLSRFRLLQAGRVVFSFWYTPVGRSLMEIIDATYDTLDEDHDFFLAFVAGNATSVTWQGNVRERWIAEPAL